MFVTYVSKFMKKSIIYVTIAIVISTIFTTSVAHAHVRQLITIGDKDYLWVVGSLNEPVYVDDKSGVDLRVYLADPSDPMNSKAPNAKPVEGLEKTLKVEISAGGKKVTKDLSPVFGQPGAYSAPFYPTVATTFSYRFFGTVDGIPVDITFTCSQGGESSGTDNTVVKLSDKVVRKMSAGGYGCPNPKSDAGFPEPYVSNVEINQRLQQIQTTLQNIQTSFQNQQQSSMPNNMVIAGIITGIIGIGVGIGALVIANKANKKRESK